MKKKFMNLLFPYVLLGMGLIACNEKEDANLEPEIKVIGETGYLSLNLAQTDPSTKAPDDDYGIEPEYKVDSVRMVLYKVKDGIAAYSFDIDATNNGGKELFTGDDVATVVSPGSRRFIMKAKEIEVDDYYLLALLNYPPEVEAITREGNHFDDFGNAIHNLGNDYTKLIGVSTPRYSTSNNDNYSFFMSNFKKEVFLEGKRVLYETEEEAETNPVYIILDRAVAKVRFKYDELQPENGTVKDIAWKLDITNKQSYWIRHAAKMLNGAWEPRGEMDRTELYAEDPNFDNISKLRNPSLTTNPNTYFNYITKADIIDDNCEWEYVAENTMEAEEQWEDVTTRLVFRLKFIPTGFSEGESYYWWKGYAFTIAQMKTFADDILAIPATFNGLQEILSDLIADGYDFTNPTITNHLEIEFYKDGISYFATPIRHFNDEQAPAKMQYGRYGIVRNNQYVLNLKKISGPGKPDIPGPGSENDDTAYLSIDCEIQNWYSRDIQDIEE